MLTNPELEKKQPSSKETSSKPETDKLVHLDEEVPAISTIDGTPTEKLEVKHETSSKPENDKIVHLDQEIPPISTIDGTAAEILDVKQDSKTRDLDSTTVVDVKSTSAP